jgi:hypothetical protein
MSPPHGLRAEHPDNEANTPRIIPSKPKKAQANLEDDDDLDSVDMDAVAVDMQEYLDDEEMMDDVDSDDDNFLCGEDDDSDLTSPASGGPFVFEETGHESEGVNVGIRDQFKEYVEDHVGNFLPFSKDEVTAIKLLSVLKLKKAPINAYKSLMEWHLKQKGELQYYQGIQDSKTYISREKILKKLSDRYNYGWMYPYKKKIKLPVSGTVIRQTLHYTGSVFQSLLTDPRLEDADYLFYDENPLAPPPKSHKTISDLHTGKAFRHTHRLEITPGTRQQLLPVILYIDGSAISHFHDLEVIQVKVSLGFWTRETRTKEYTWGILGYIEKIHEQGGKGHEIWEEGNHMERQDGHDSDDGSSTCASLEGLGDEKRQDFHAQLGSILVGLKGLIHSGLLWDPKYKGILYRDVHYKPFVPYCKCDTKEADDLCGKFQMRSGNVKQICRYCHVLLQEANDHLHHCVYKTEPEIKRLVDKGDKDGLKDISQTYLKNAFHGVKFNKGNTRGIHGACPSDMLHAFQLGIFKYLRDVFFKYIGGKPADAMNGLSGKYCKQFKRQSDKSMPSTSFAKGIKEGKLMGKEFRGVLLNILVLLHSTAGRKILRSSTKKKIKEPEQIADWSMLVELLLEWEAYLHLPELETRHLRRLHEKHRYIMYLMRRIAKREEGMGLKLMKFHAILHLVEDIYLYGVPLEFDTSANESHHKSSKQAARLTQRSHSTFNVQTATRLTEFKLIDLAMLELDEGKVVWEYYDGLEEEPSDESDDPEKESDEEGDEMEVDLDSGRSDDQDFEVEVKSGSAKGVLPGGGQNQGGSEDVEIETGGTKIRVLLGKDGTPNFHLGGRSKFKDGSRWSTNVIDFLFDLQGLISQETKGIKYELPIFTKHKRGDQVWRAHPNYMGKGPWRDWAWVKYDKAGEFCCHLWCFVMIPDLGRKRIDFGGTWLEKGTFAVMESAELADEMEDVRKGDLLQPILKEVVMDSDGKVVRKKLYLANTDAFAAPACVVPDIGGPPNRYYVIEPRTTWHEHFINFIESPHEEMDTLPSDQESDFEEDGSDFEDEAAPEKEAKNKNKL